MKIVYLGNFNNTGSDATEEHIKYAFEKLGHEVMVVPETDLPQKAIETILNVKDSDMFLFHKAGVGSRIQLEVLIKLLTYVTCKKVFWYFDKIFPDREEFILNVAQYVDYGFITDDTWLRRRNASNLFCLKQGVGNENTKLGKFKKEYECDVAFIGNAYDGRQEFVKILTEAYGDKFKIFNNVFNRDLYDLCASAKTIIAPAYPNDDFYWSSRIYMTLGSGGFLIHPDLYGLRSEFTEGKHFVGYRGFKEMLVAIDYFINPEHEKERKEIQMAGYKRCLEVATYLDRVKEMLKICENSKRKI